MSQWWNLTEKTTTQPLSVHEQNVDTFMKSYFPEVPVLGRGIWYRLRKMLAFIASQLEASSVQSNNDIKTLLTQQLFPNELWWATKIKEFQYGDELVVDKGQIGYLTVLPALRIIKHASVRTNYKRTFDTSDLIIKYAKDRFGLATIEEKTALNKYVEQIKVAGVRVRVQEAVADQIKLTVRVDNYVSDQSVDETPLNQGVGIPFGRVLSDHFKRLPFDGVFSLSEAEKALQDTFANHYIRITKAEYKSANNGAYTPIESVVASDGGYFNLDAANSRIAFK
jgi:hypothetical protein